MSGAEIKTDLNVSVVRADDGDALVFRRILNLVDEGTIAQRCFGQILSGRIVRHVPAPSRGTRCCFPNSGRGGKHVTALGSGWTPLAIVASGNAAMEKINGKNK